MSKRLFGYLTLGMIAACLSYGAAHSQMGGGGGGGGHGGGRGGHSKNNPASTSTTTAASPAIPADTPLDEIVIIGVIRAIDPQAARITIAYDPVEALNWPKGEKPFDVSKTALMKGVIVGEKVRFKLESQQISDLRPF